MLHEADLAHFLEHPDGYTATAELARIRDLGMLDADPADREVAPGLRVVHAPGHTPGHRSAVLGDEMLLTGDLMHVPIQAARPAWTSSHDEDAGGGAASRTRLVRDAVERRWVVAVPHFARPFGRVEEGGWRSLDASAAEPAH